MAFYEEAAKIDILAPVVDDIRRGIYELRADGRIEINIRVNPAIPWLWAKRTEDRLCVKWMNVYWEIYRFQPRQCQGCWKIAVKLRTVEELMKMAELQQRMNLPSKCGLDKRSYTDTAYSAFWYCPIAGGLGEARKIFERVEKAIKSQIAPDLQPILKRGCTEMELTLGPSDQWEWLEEDENFQKLLDSIWIDPPMQPEQSTNLKVNLRRRYIDWAARHGDLTYLKYREGPITPPLVAYNGSIHNEKDFPIPEVRRPEDDFGDRRFKCGKCSGGKEEGNNESDGEGIILLEDLEAEESGGNDPRSGLS